MIVDTDAIRLAIGWTMLHFLRSGGLIAIVAATLPIPSGWTISHAHLAETPAPTDAEADPDPDP